MANISQYSLFGGEIINSSDANLSVASSAVLYGLSVYSVFYGKFTPNGMLAFRIKEHLERLKFSAQIIGFTDIEAAIDEQNFIPKLKQLIEKNQPKTDQFFRLTLHANELVPGARTSNLKLTLSVFMYEANHILPQTGSKIKTSLWRRVTDASIPARAKVNGAYVNSALAKQDAIDSGFDDCLFLNQSGYVSELSAANIFMVKRGHLITPDCSSDILEGITRRSIIEIAKELNIPVTERKIALTELYTADEVFACGTSAFISPIIEVDRRKIKNGQLGEITQKLELALIDKQTNPNDDWITRL